MKLIKFLLNTFLFIFVLCLSLLASVGVYSAISYQSNDEYAIIQVKSNDENVAYTDSVEYWRDDIVNEFSDMDNRASTKYRVANWFKWGWWKTSMSNVDKYFVDPIVKVVKPVVLPIACADEIKTYYGKDVSDFIDYINKSDETTFAFKNMCKYYYPEVYKHIENSEITKEVLEPYAIKITLEALVNSDIAGKVDKNTMASVPNGILDIYDVAHDYNYFYQLLFKLHKYNRTVKDKTGNDYKLYEKWYNKFIFADSNGDRHLKSSIYGLYTIELLSLVFSIFFVHENPIEIKRNEYGENEISGIKLKKHKKKNKK